MWGCGGVGSASLPDEGEGPPDRGGRFVLEWGSGGGIDRLRLHMREKRPRVWSVFDCDMAGERKTIYLHAIIAFTGIQNSIFLIRLKHRLQQVAENGGKKKNKMMYV